MPARDEHLRLARANRDHSQRLLAAFTDDPVARQWSVVAAFYSALHGVEAYFATFDRHNATHVQRRNAMVDPQRGIPGKVYFAYVRLEEWSLGARYNGLAIDNRIVAEALDRFLPAIAAFVGMDQG